MTDRSYLQALGALKIGTIAEIIGLFPSIPAEAVRETLRRLEREELIEWHPDMQGMRLTVCGLNKYGGG